MKREDVGAGGREGLYNGRYTDVRVFRSGWSPVFAASLLGDVSCVEALIRGKADVLQCNK